MFFLSTLGCSSPCSYYQRSLSCSYFWHSLPCPCFEHFSSCFCCRCSSLCSCYGRSFDCSCFGATRRALVLGILHHALVLGLLVVLYFGDAATCTRWNCCSTFQGKLVFFFQFAQRVFFFFVLCAFCFNVIFLWLCFGFARPFISNQLVAQIVLQIKTLI